MTYLNFIDACTIGPGPGPRPGPRLLKARGPGPETLFPTHLTASAERLWGLCAAAGRQVAAQVGHEVRRVEEARLAQRRDALPEVRVIGHRSVGQGEGGGGGRRAE